MYFCLATNVNDALLAMLLKFKLHDALTHFNKRGI